MKTTLYAKDAKNQIRIWSVEILADGIYMEHGVLGGGQQTKFEEVECGLASRTLEEQIRSRAKSRISKKIDSGYCESLEDAKNKPRTNSLGFKKPMLAAKFKDVKNIDYDNLYIQHKYDGNRMLITNHHGENIAYTRQGKIIDSVPEILEGIVIPEGITIDGEIYCHGEKLQTIVSWVKKRQENSKKLRFHAYDVMIDSYYNIRLEMLRSFELGEFAKVVPTWLYSKGIVVETVLDDSIKKGYEGVILRQNNFGYQDGKRSKSLIKVKKFLDCELEIVDIYLSKDRLPMLKCKISEGLYVNPTAPGTFEQKRSIFKNRNEYIGKFVHLEYAFLTDDGIPFHPVATKILDHEDQLK